MAARGPNTMTLGERQEQLARECERLLCLLRNPRNTLDWQQLTRETTSRVHALSRDPAAQAALMRSPARQFQAKRQPAPVVPPLGDTPDVVHLEAIPLPSIPGMGEQP